MLCVLEIGKLANMNPEYCAQFCFKVDWDELKKKLVIIDMSQTIKQYPLQHVAANAVRQIIIKKLDVPQNK